jgi:hypothetical protein
MRFFALDEQSPSVRMAHVGNACIKEINKGIKKGRKLHNKYKADYAKFKRKWLKQHQHWGDGRQKKKAMTKAFVKKYPQYSFYIQLERIGRKCKI